MSNGTLRDLMLNIESLLCSPARSSCRRARVPPTKYSYLSAHQNVVIVPSFAPCAARICPDIGASAVFAANVAVAFVLVSSFGEVFFFLVNVFLPSDFLYKIYS